MRGEHRCLSLKTKYGAIDIRLAGKNADIVRQISRRKIIRSINDNVIFCHEVGCVFTGKPAFVQFDFYLRIDIVQAIPSRLQFAPADVFCSVKNLSLEIGKIDIVEIDNPNCPDASGCQVKRGWRSKSSGTDA